MEYRLLGRTGVSVSPLCLGTMMFGPWGNDDRADAIRVIHRALDAGINFVDTADVYSGGASEEIVGEALQGRRDDIVLATKFFMPMDAAPNHSGGSRKWIIREVENSLRRLKTDYIDLYQVHRPSSTTDVEETLGALTTSSAKARSATSARRPTRPARSSRRNGPPASAISNVSSRSSRRTRSSSAVSRRTSSRPPSATAWAPSSTARCPAAGSPAVGARMPPGAPTSGARPNARFDMSLAANQRKLDVVEELVMLAEQAGMTLIELALAWAINHPGVTSAIIGPRTMEQLESQLPAAELTLTTEILDRVDELVPPPPRV